MNLSSMRPTDSGPVAYAVACDLVNGDRLWWNAVRGWVDKGPTLVDDNGKAVEMCRKARIAAFKKRVNNPKTFIVVRFIIIELYVSD